MSGPSGYESLYDVEDDLGLEDGLEHEAEQPESASAGEAVDESGSDGSDAEDPRPDTLGECAAQWRARADRAPPDSAVALLLRQAADHADAMAAQRCAPPLVHATAMHAPARHAERGVSG